MDDDIDVLTPGEHDYSEDPLFNPRADNLSNMHISFTKDDKDGSLHALQTAYLELKKRYRDQECRINSLQIVIRDMETQRISNMRPNSGVYGAAGPSSAAAVSPPVDDYQIRAEFGFAKNLERQLIRAKTNLRNMESERKDLLSKVDSFQKDVKRLQLLNQDKDKQIESLQNELRARGPQPSSPQVKINSAEVSQLKHLLMEKERDVNSLNEKCQNLESKLRLQDITSDEQRQLLDQVDQYRQTMRDLKEKVNHQSKLLHDQQGLMKKIITEQNKPKHPASPIMRYADGASFGPPHIETNVEHGFVMFEKGTPRSGAQYGPEQGQRLPGNTGYPTLMTLTDRTGERQLETKSSKIPQTSTWTPAEQQQASCFTNVCDVDNDIDRTSRIGNPQFFRRNSGGKSAPQENVCIGDISDGHTITASDPRVGQGKRTKSPQMQYVQPEISVYENISALPNANDSKPKSPRNSYTSNMDNNVPRFSRKTSEHSPYSASRESARENEDYVNIENIHPAQRQTPVGLSKKVVREETLEKNTPIVSSNIRINQAEENAVFPSADQMCPVCNQKFPNINIEDFQLHVLNCMDNDNDDEEQCITLQHNEHTPIVRHAGSNSDNRICPMCDASFPAELPQSEFERHVQEHFGEDPITDRFEVLSP